MKKTILIFFIIAISAAGLLAQDKKADSTTTLSAEPKTSPYTLTHKDSLAIQNAMKNAQSQEYNYMEDMLPVSRLAMPSFTDLIDVEHEIK